VNETRYLITKYATKHAASEGRTQPMPVTCGLKPQVCIRLNVGMAVSNAAEGVECSSVALPVCYTGSGLYDELIRSEGPYLVCVCVCVCVRLTVRDLEHFKMRQPRPDLGC